MAEEIKKIVSIDTEGSQQTVAGLRREMSELRNVLLNTTKGSEEYDKAVKKLNADQQTLNNVMSVTTNGFSGMRNELKQARDAMANAAQGTEEYAVAAQKAATAAAKLRDMQAEIRYGDAGLDGQFEITAKMASELAGGFQAAQGAMSLFGVESEALEKRFVQLQAAMSVTSGLKALSQLPKSLNAAKVAFGGVKKGVDAFKLSLKGVKGAIAATGLGVFLVLLGELINHWDDVKAATERFSGTLDRVKEVLAGVGNVVKNLVMGPLKALGQAFELDFKGAWQTIKQSFSIKANFETGYNAQSVKNTEKAERKKQKASYETTQEYIKDMEAKKGADWKYTKEGQESYQKMFDARLKMYKKDSKEYKEAQREKWEYEHQLEEKGKKKSSSSKKGGKSAEEEAEDLRKKIEEVRAGGQEAIQEVLNNEAQRRLAEFREEVKKITPVLKNAFSNEPLVKFNAALQKTAMDVVDEYANVLIATKDGERAIESFYEALKTGNKQAIENMMPTFEKLLNKKDFARFKEMTMAVLQGENLALENYLGALEKGNKKALEAYDKLFEISHQSGYLLWSDLDTFTKAYNKLFEDYRKVEDKIIGTKKIEQSLDVASRLFKDSWHKLEAEVYDFEEEAAKLYQNAPFRNFGYWEKFFGLPQPMELKTRLEKITNTIYEFYDKYKGKSLDSPASLMNEIIGAFNENDLSNNVNALAALFDFRAEESLKDYNREITYNNQMLALDVERYENKIKLLMLERQVYDEDTEERKEIEQEIYELNVKRNEAITKTVIDNTDLQIKKYKAVENTIKSLVPSTINLFGSMSDIMQNFANKNAEVNEAAARKQFEASKALGITETIISTLSTVQNIIKSYSGMGPWGTAAGIVAGAAALAAGFARVQQIRNQKFDSNSSASAGSSSVSMGTAVSIPDIGQDLPYDYVRNYTTGEDEDEYNKRPIIVQVSDISDALKQEENRKSEVSF